MLVILFSVCAYSYDIGFFTCSVILGCPGTFAHMAATLLSESVFCLVLIIPECHCDVGRGKTLQGLCPMSCVPASGQKPLLPAVQQGLDKGRGRTDLHGLNQSPNPHAEKRPSSPPLLLPTASELPALCPGEPCPGTSLGPRFPIPISWHRPCRDSPARRPIGSTSSIACAAPGLCCRLPELVQGLCCHFRVVGGGGGGRLF